MERRGPYTTANALEAAPADALTLPKAVQTIANQKLASHVGTVIPSMRSLCASSSFTMFTHAPFRDGRHHDWLGYANN